MNSFIKAFLLFILTCHSSFAYAQTYTVETVPNTKLINNSYVSNPDGLLQESTASEINRQLSALENSATAQVAVVMLTSIGEESEVDFAQQLFQAWGIGQDDKDNGLLILYVQDQRVIRFHTGYGLEGVLPDAICKRIQREFMVPRFKEGDTDGGLLAGIEQVNKILTDPAYAAEIKSQATSEETSWMTNLSGLFAMIWIPVGLLIFFSKRSDGFSNSQDLPQGRPNAFMSSGQWLMVCFFLPMLWFGFLAYLANGWLFFWGVYAYLMSIRLYKYGRIMSRANEWIKRGDYPVVKRFLEDQGSWTGSAIFFPIPFIFLNVFFNKRVKTIRHHPRTCKECKSAMRVLSEKEEDAYLDEQMQLEEKINSVDYDVWVCTQCTAVAIWPFINASTKYNTCPNCKAVAYLYENRIFKKATTTETGKQEETRLCLHCGHKKITETVLSKISISTSSSSSDDSGSSWSSSSSDSSSSSSDSGGSWGGGDSGGGGSSSNW
jgi:uncharacterized protein